MREPSPSAYRLSHNRQDHTLALAAPNHWLNISKFHKIPSSPQSCSFIHTTDILRCEGTSLDMWEFPGIHMLASVEWQRGPFMFCLHECLQMRKKRWPWFMWLLLVSPQAEAEDGLLLYCGESEHGRGDFMSLALIRRSLHFR